jgi:hypothetical protein
MFLFVLFLSFEAPRYVLFLSFEAPQTLGC